MKHLLSAVGVMLVLSCQPAGAAEVEVKVFKGVAIVRADDAPREEVLERAVVNFDRKIEVGTPGPFAAMSVDLGEHGFIRVDYGRVNVLVTSDGTVRVINHGGQVYVDDCKKLIREGNGRWIISH